MKMMKNVCLVCAALCLVLITIAAFMGRVAELSARFEGQPSLEQQMIIECREETEELVSAINEIYEEMEAE